ncbi:RDD family protein [Flavobacterium sp.]|uniref:RDD family protein n=1 Tax=Flavobacterium sp. TaxID=239 RepID=UPI00391D5FFD
MEHRKQFTVSEELLASHGQRFLNLLIDTIIQVVLLFIALVFAVAIAESNGNKSFITNLPANTLAQYTFTACIALFYYNVFEIFSARTVGKWITQTVVVDQNGEKPNSEMIMVRSLCRLIPFNALSIIGFPARTWHDSLSKTYVVDKKALEEEKRLFYKPKSNHNEE